MKRISLNVVAVHEIFHAEGSAVLLYLRGDIVIPENRLEERERGSRFGGVYN